MAIYPKMEVLSVRDETTCDFNQCGNRAMEGSARCQLHGGNFDLERKNKAAVRAYRLGQWQQRVNEFADSEVIKSLREEIGISRMLLESVLKQCEDDFDLLISSTRISMLVQNIDKLVTSCHKMEEKLGYTLDKSTVINLSEQIIQIISEHVPQEQLEFISNKIGDAITTIGEIKDET